MPAYAKRATGTLLSLKPTAAAREEIDALLKTYPEIKVFDSLDPIQRELDTKMAELIEKADVFERCDVYAGATSKTDPEWTDILFRCGYVYAPRPATRASLVFDHLHRYALEERLEELRTTCWMRCLEGKAPDIIAELNATIREMYAAKKRVVLLELHYG